jgi:hypothetical protein
MREELPRHIECNKLRKLTVVTDWIRHDEGFSEMGINVALKKGWQVPCTLLKELGQKAWSTKSFERSRIRSSNTHWYEEMMVTVRHVFEWWELFGARCVPFRSNWTHTVNRLVFLWTCFVLSPWSVTFHSCWKRVPLLIAAYGCSEWRIREPSSC